MSDQRGNIVTKYLVLHGPFCHHMKDNPIFHVAEGVHFTIREDEAAHLAWKRNAVMLKVESFELDDPVAGKTCKFTITGEAKIPRRPHYTH